MSRRKADPAGKAADKAKQEKVSKISKVDFELPDDELGDAAGGAQTRTLTTYQEVSLTCPPGHKAS